MYNHQQLALIERGPLKDGLAEFADDLDLARSLSSPGSHLAAARDDGIRVLYPYPCEQLFNVSCRRLAKKFGPMDPLVVEGLQRQKEERNAAG
ncbi:uncharacterized protein BXZ73DRAFT_103372 [Epithele typhae]|uniref:uncharacterized protein n=1 Tax=Epithele typhae TaxID=378194 RepID=UPI002007C8D7|nr:uncharacterized protein BXZ73DRAFT_103372 [Epithele typhae]KAH9924996.1 hypothetical protein BXZ73DRAFT_103372 [Epithele typhae]